MTTKNTKITEDVAAVKALSRIFHNAENPWLMRVRALNILAEISLMRDKEELEERSNERERKWLSTVTFF